MIASPLCQEHFSMVDPCSIGKRKRKRYPRKAACPKCGFVRQVSSLNANCDCLRCTNRMRRERIARVAELKIVRQLPCKAIGPQVGCTPKNGEYLWSRAREIIRRSSNMFLKHQTL